MIVGGVVTDRFSSRRVLIATAVVRTILVGTTAILMSLGILELWWVFVLSFVFGVADAFTLPAAGALLPTLVERGQLQAANSVTQSSHTLAELTGPGVAGLVIRYWGASIAMFVDAVTFIPMILALHRIPKSEKKDSVQTKTSESIREGFRAVINDRPVLWLMLHFAVLNMCLSGPLGIGLAVMSKVQFGSPTFLGTALTCLSVGALAGALLGGAMKQFRRIGGLIVLISILTGLELIVISLTMKYIVILAMLTLMSCGAALLNVILATWIQARTEPSVMGRVIGVLMFLTLGMTPFSFAIGGVFAEGNLTAMFIVGGSVIIISSIIIWISRISRNLD
jgi:MFS family permease